jgi:hypothetical protein
VEGVTGGGSGERDEEGDEDESGTDDPGEVGLRASEGGLCQSRGSLANLPLRTIFSLALPRIGERKEEKGREEKGNAPS